jgi:hypothetical protein
MTRRYAEVIANGRPLLGITVWMVWHGDGGKGQEGAACGGVTRVPARAPLVKGRQPHTMRMPLSLLPDLDGRGLADKACTNKNKIDLKVQVSIMWTGAVECLQH